jgi:hypothetical protein
MTIDCLLHHPMVVALDYHPGAAPEETDWFCRVAVPNADQYATERKPGAARRRGCPLSEPDLWILASRWLERRGVRVHCTHLGLLQPQRRRLWVADVVGERAGRLVMAATYYSRRRKGRAREDMRAYTAALAEVCRRCYRIPGAVAAVINVYGDGRAEGEFLPEGPAPARAPGRPALTRRRARALEPASGPEQGLVLDGDLREGREEAGVGRVLPADGDVPGVEGHAEPLVEQGERVGLDQAGEVQGGHAEPQEGLGPQPGAPAGLAAQVQRDRLLDPVHLVHRGGREAGELGPLDPYGGVGPHARLDERVHPRLARADGA